VSSAVHGGCKTHGLSACVHGEIIISFLSMKEAKKRRRRRERNDDDKKKKSIIRSCLYASCSAMMIKIDLKSITMYL
jgi:hypothetical protein